MDIHLGSQLPAYPSFVAGIRRAPDRGYSLTSAQTETALKNALRYIPKELHETLAPEFMEELRTRGRIYGYRYRPEGDLKARPIDDYQGNCLEGKAFQVMIDNNLCFDIALYPYELVTYGETGQVCQNWMQYRLIKQYLEIMTQEQTLVIESGHPLGLFRSRPDAPRVIITNSMMVGMFDNQKDWHVAAQMGVANYGQMTAGGWMYIGPQGIVHGTFNTLLNAGRLKLGIPQDKDLRGHLFVSSGLGGMSGAQPKAAVIAGAACIVAEVDRSRIETRHSQGWVQLVTDNEVEAFRLATDACRAKEPLSIAYHGNIVDLLEYAASESIPIDLLSDQTSCHAVYEGGYCPAGSSFEERTRLLSEDQETFCALVDRSLRRHYEVIKRLVDASNFNAAYACLRQVSFGLLDMAWYTRNTPFEGDVKEYEQQSWAKAQILPVVKDACMSTQFSHIFAGGYSAGYYSYKWAEVLDADAFSLFKQKGIFNREVAESFRNNILSKGGTEHPMILYKRFRGQEPTIDALLIRNGIKENTGN